MSILEAVLIGLGMGVVFGFTLEKSRVFEPGMIVGQMQLRNFTMLKVFLTAVATGAVVLSVLHGSGLVKLYPKPALYGADIFGGLLLGVGIAVAGACPGTILAQVGVGYRDAIFTLLGGIAGATAFGYAEPLLKPILLLGGGGKDHVCRPNRYPLLGSCAWAGGSYHRGARWPREVASLATRHGPRCRW